MIIEAFAIPFSIGLMGAGHCLGMCGGIVGALSFSASDVINKYQNVYLLLSYNSGRIFSYILLGVIAGGLGELFTSQVQPIIQFPVLRFFAASLIVLLGLYLMGIPQLLSPLERVGTTIWRRIQPLSKNFIPIQTPAQGVIVGMVWGWLPCGLVYTNLAYAIAQESIFYGGLSMLAFGLGTLPALILGGLTGQSLKAFLKSQNVRRASGVLMIVFGLWSMFGVFHHNHGQVHNVDHSAHEHNH